MSLFRTILLLAAAYAMATCHAPPVAPAAETTTGKTTADWAAELKADDSGVRRRAAYALGRMGPAAAASVPALTAAVKDRQLEVAWYALDALGRIGPASRDAVPAIVAAMQDPKSDKNIRRHAAIALARIGTDAKAAVPALRAATKHKDAVFRVAAADAWWRIARDVGAIERLASQLSVANASATFAAATALADIGLDAAPAVPQLVEALGSDDPDTRRAVARALGRIGLPAVAPLTERLHAGSPAARTGAIRALGWIADAIRTTVLDRPETSDGDFRIAATTIYTQIVPPLSAGFGDSDPEVRRAAQAALARAGPPAVPALLRSLLGDDPRSRASAAHAVTQLGRHLPPAQQVPRGAAAIYKKSLPRLIEGLRHRDRNVRGAAFRLFASLAIGDYGREAADALREGLRDKDITIRRDAHTALRRLDAKP